MMTLPPLRRPQQKPGVGATVQMTLGQSSWHGFCSTLRLLNICVAHSFQCTQAFALWDHLATMQGLLPPLDPPHHLRRNEWLSYREGVVLDKSTADGEGSYVNVGLAKDVIIFEKLKPSTRVTVEMGSRPNFSRLSGEKLKAVAPSEPREKAGLYWGYSVRVAPSFSSVFTDCPFKDGYDYSIGTSEHGDKPHSSDFVIPAFKHLLIVFGGVTGLEWSLKQDSNLEVDEVSYLFDRYLNTCPAQGSRTIRTEEAILISLQYLQNPIERACE